MRKAGVKGTTPLKTRFVPQQEEIEDIESWIMFLNAASILCSISKLSSVSNDKRDWLHSTMTDV